MKKVLKKMIIGFLVFSLCIPNIRFKVYAEQMNEMADEIINECLDSGYYKLDENGKLTLTAKGKVHSSNQSINYNLLQVVPIFNPISPNDYIDLDYGVGITYKNETKVVTSGITEYVYMSHSRAQSHIKEMTNYKTVFGYTKLTDSYAYNFVTIMFGALINPAFATALSMIIMLFKVLKDFLTYYLDIVNSVFKQTNIKEGIIVIWWKSGKVIQAKRQLF